MTARFGRWRAILRARRYRSMGRPSRGAALALAALLACLCSPCSSRLSAAQAAVGPADEPARFERLYWFRPGIEFGNPVLTSHFRVNAPEAVLHPTFGRRSETRGNGMMQILFEEDLFQLAAAELYLETWGGHTGTANKRVTINGRTTYLLPKVGTEERHCTHQYPTIALAITDLVSGYNALQFACDQGSTFWGHFIVEAACLRAILRADHQVLAQAGLDNFAAKVVAKPAADGERMVLSLDLDQRLAEKVAAVEYEAYYDGYDENGNRLTRDWHGFTKDARPVATLPAPQKPLDAVTWDLSMLPDQVGMAARAYITFKEPASLRYRTAVTAGLRTPPRAGRVALLVSDDIPERFWSRAGRKKSCTINVGVDPTEIDQAELHVVLWGSGPGEVEDYFTINGHRLALPCHDHRSQYSCVAIDAGVLRRGANDVVVYSDTEHHGIEVLLPGPALVVRQKGPK